MLNQHSKGDEALSRRRFSISRSHYLIAFLVLGLGFTGMLAYEAHRASSSQQATAERAIEDHAAVAAWNYAGHLEKKIDWAIAQPSFTYLKKSRDKWDWEPSEEFSQEYGEAIRCAFSIDTNGGFEIDPKTGAFTLREGPDPDPGVEEWIRQEIAAGLETYDPEWSYSMIYGAPDGKTHVVFYKVEYDREEKETTAIIGFEADLGAMPEAFRYAFKGHLLPPSLTEGRKNEDIMSVEVLGPAGEILWASSADVSWAYSAVDYLSPQFSNLPVAVALQPSMAESLVIGGLPKSRLPLILGLLFFAGLLVVATIFLLRRELELGRMRTEFVSNVSHELRTPLAQIRMFVETLMLNRVRSEEERRRSLEIMNREIRRLGNLVENILTFSRAERGTMKLKLESTELGSLFAEVADSFRPLASGRNMELDTDIHEDTVATVDRAAVRQILLNLLDNAVKYGPTGQTVSLGLEVHNGAVLFRVDDEGPGIPQSDRRAVWDAFVRLDREREQATAGTGIGLSVVRELVIRHGGQVWVETSPSGGARFCVEIPKSQRIADGVQAA